MHDDAAGYFGSMVAEYDSLIHRAVPGYSEMLARMLAYVPGQPRRVLELGCGTGNYSALLAERWPRADLTLVDGSAEMLAAAQHRIGPDRAVHTIGAMFEDVELQPGSYDLVTSCIAIHHVRDKQPLFRKLRAALEPGGSFVFGDQMGGRPAGNHRVNWNSMVAFWELPGHCTAEEMRSLSEHAEAHDHYEPVFDQMRQLERAGFVELDCVWRNWLWAVVTARAGPGG